MVREARTEPLPVENTPDPVESDAIEGTVETAPANSVTLSDGRVAVLAENSAFAARQARKALSRMGLSMQEDMLDYALGQAIMSIETIDGQPFKKPHSKVDMDAFLMGMTESDSYKIAQAYNAIIGIGNTKDSDFR